MVPERQKMQWFQVVQEDVDVVFLGSSHVFRQFDPQVFDRVRGASEGPLRSINMGALGMGLHEESYLLRQLLAAPAPHLKWIVVEALPFDMQLQNENDFGLRRLEWHDTQLTLPLLFALWESDLPAAEKWPLMQRHFEHWWRRSLNLARGMEVASYLSEEPFTLESLSNLGPNLDGYIPLSQETATNQSKGMRRIFLQDSSSLTQAARSLPQVGDGGAADPRLRQLVVQMEELAASKSIGLIWWIHPNLERYSGWRQMEHDGDLRHLVAHDDPARYPQFYQPRWHFDLYHLNRGGAEMLTTLFAQQFQTLSSAAEERAAQ